MAQRGLQRRKTILGREAEAEAGVELEVAEQELAHVLQLSRDLRRWPCRTLSVTKGVSLLGSETK